MMWAKYLLIAAIGYLLGNITGGILIARLWGIKDIRTRGSGNAGSTNVLRTLGWLPSVLTLVCDCAKGYIAARIGHAIAGDVGLMIGGLAAVLGHDFPALFRFRGGKGIATSLGIALAMQPWIGLLLLALEIAVIAITRVVSVASLISCAAFPVLTALMMRGSAHYTGYVVTAALAGALSVFLHRKNIGRLIRHEENKLDFGKISRLSKKQ